MNMRKALAIVALWLPPAAIAITWAFWRENLPSALPTHWGNSGPADAVTSAPVFFGWMLGVATASALLGTVLLLVSLTGKWVQRAIGATAGATGAFVLAMWLGSTVNALGVTDPYTVELGGWLLLTFVAPAYGLIPLLLLPKGATRPVDVAHPGPIEPMEFTPTQTVAWSRTISSWLFVAATALMVVVGAVLYVPPVLRHGLEEVGFGLFVYVAALFMVSAFCAFRVTVDWRGLRVTSLLFGIPLKRVAPDNIQAVETAVLEPTQWGGWGYRVMPGRSAIILRKGPGLVVTQRDQKQFAITLERPEEPASILLGLLAQQHADR